jgi:hypothetical protein
MLPFPMLSSTSTPAPRSPVVPSPPLYKSPHQCHSMGVTSPLFSYSYALFCTAKNPNPFLFIFFRTLYPKHPGWGSVAQASACPLLSPQLKSNRASAPFGTDRGPLIYPEPRRVYPARPARPACPACPEQRREERREPRRAPIPFRIRTYAKPTRNPFTMSTSKTQDLKSFRIRTYEKNPGGRGPLQWDSQSWLSPFG